MFRGFSRQTPPSQRLEVMLAGEAMPLVIRYRRNARRLTLRVEESELRVTAPIRADTDEILGFIRDKTPWITARLSALSALYADAVPSILYRGESTPVHINRAFRGHQYQMDFMDGALWLHRPQGGRLSPSRQLEKHLRSETKTAIQAVLPEMLARLGEAAVPFSIRDQKTRWGSCSTRRHLSFNWRLIMAPPAVLNYVVQHEVAHLRHHDHSQRFWKLVEAMMPDYNQHRQWLNTHQQNLMINLERKLAGLK